MLGGVEMGHWSFMSKAGWKRTALLSAVAFSLIYYLLGISLEVTTAASLSDPLEIHPCTYEDNAPDSPIELHMPFRAGQTWYPGGDGSFYGDGEHTDSNHDYYATDWNKGVDMFHKEADEGEDVLPVADGTIAEVNYNRWLGYYARIDHVSGIQTTYAHLQVRPSWSQNQPIKRWEMVGRVGETGNASGAHLHLSFKKDGDSRKVLGSPKPSPMLTKHGPKKLCDNAQNGPYISANEPFGSNTKPFNLWLPRWYYLISTGDSRVTRVYLDGNLLFEQPPACAKALWIGGGNHTLTIWY
jgi:hypothetical protein